MTFSDDVTGDGGLSNLLPGQAVQWRRVQHERKPSMSENVDPPIYKRLTKYSSNFNKRQIASTVPQNLHKSTSKIAPIFLSVVHL